MKIIPVVLVCLLSAGDSACTQPATAQQTATPTSASVPANPAAPPQPNTLLDGTAVKLRLAENLTSATAKAG